LASAVAFVSAIASVKASQPRKIFIGIAPSLSRLNPRRRHSFPAGGAEKRAAAQIAKLGLSADMLCC